MAGAISLVGTTSAGKSTICNLLSGYSLLPAGVQQTTQVITELRNINSNNGRAMVEIERRGRTGYKDGLKTFEDVRRYVKESAVKAEEEVNRITIEMSLNFHTNSVWSGLAYKCNSIACRRYSIIDELDLADDFVIRDFPGFQHIEDISRLKLLRNNLKPKGKILFVFNGEETDDRKESKLLETIFGVLKAQQRSIEHVLFVLNRKDAYLRDDNGDGALNEALCQKSSLIVKYAEQVLNDDCQTPTIIPLSAGLMLPAELLFWGNDALDKDSSAFQKARLSEIASTNLPSKTLAKLPRSINKWNYFRWIEVYRSLRETTGTDLFIDALSKLIRDDNRPIES